MRILVLGHKGMLGRTLVRYFALDATYKILTTTTRWGDMDFLGSIKNLSPDFIINCIGKIPQKNPADLEYKSINIELPRTLEKLGTRIIHPSTDCEFSGKITPGHSYRKSDTRDAVDVYGKSKALISEEIEHTYTHTKIIRTSIIGHEENTQVALLDWFLSQNKPVRGYTNHFWNGITTLEWAKQAEQIIQNWENKPTLNQFGTHTHYSKFDILTIAKEVYQKKIQIIPFETETTVNKCLTSDEKIPELRDQLGELKAFFAK